MIHLTLVFCAILAVAKGNVADYISSADDYINMNRHQYAKVLEDYDTKLNHFKEHYLGRIDSIDVLVNMVTAGIDLIEERLNPYELLSDFSKQCVTSYRYMIPSVTLTKESVEKCISDASNEVKRLLSGAYGTRNALKNYYTVHFEGAIKNCRSNSYSLQNYTGCIVKVVDDTNVFTTGNQKTFDNQLDVAECSAKADVKRSLSCFYTIQSNVTTKIAEANLLIERCLESKDQCKPCDPSTTCSESVHLMLDTESRSIMNPLYNRRDNPTCLLLRLSHS